MDGVAASDLAERSIALARRSGEPWTIAFCLMQAHRALSDRCTSPTPETREAARALEEALALARLTGDPFILCQALRVKGELLLVDRRWAEAETLLRESMSIACDGDDLHSIVMAVLSLTCALHCMGMPIATKALYLDTLRMTAEAGARSFFGCLLGGLSWVAIAEAKPVRAARLWGAAMAAGVPGEGFPEELPSGLSLTERDGMAEWSRGHEMSPEESVAYALSDT
jgi:hypothetical protein